MLEQNVPVTKLVEALERVKSQGIESISVFELLHILPDDEAVEQMRAADACPKCGQVPNGQGGEYPCTVCGVPTLHDS